jgi:hypothetical protein
LGAADPLLLAVQQLREDVLSRLERLEQHEGGGGIQVGKHIYPKLCSVVYRCVPLFVLHSAVSSAVSSAGSCTLLCYDAPLAVMSVPCAVLCGVLVFLCSGVQSPQ